MQTRFEDGVFGLVNKKDLLDVGYEVTRPNDPVDQLIGDLRTDNLMAEYETIAAEYDIPVMAQYHAFDTEAQKTMRAPIDNHNIEKGLIKVKIDQSERLRALLDNGVREESTLVRRVFNDGYNLAQQVVTRTKVAKNEVLYSGKMTIKENNLDITIDYGVPTANLQKTLDFGEGAAKPITEQIQEIIDEASGNGIVLNGIYTSRANITKMLNDPSLQKVIYGALGTGTQIERSRLEAYLAAQYGINRIITNDLLYSKPLTAGTNGRPVVDKRRYYPQDKVTFFSANTTLGIGLWGDPPEVSASRFMSVEQSEESPYVFVSQYSEMDPAVIWTKASGLFVPALFKPDGLYVATVTATPAS